MIYFHHLRLHRRGELLCTVMRHNKRTEIGFFFWCHGHIPLVIGLLGVESWKSPMGVMGSASLRSTSSAADNNSAAICRASDSFKKIKIRWVSPTLVRDLDSVV